MAGKRKADPWRERVDCGDWDAITAEVNSCGGALLPQLLTAAEAAQMRSLYGDTLALVFHDAR